LAIAILYVEHIEMFSLNLNGHGKDCGMSISDKAYWQQQWSQKGITNWWKGAGKYFNKSKKQKKMVIAHVSANKDVKVKW